MPRKTTLFVLHSALEGPEPAEHKEQFRFRVLPFAAIPPGAAGPPACEVVARFEDYSADYVRVLRGIDWLLQQGIQVLSLSFGPKDKRFDRHDPLQVATRCVYERGIPVVVAAGNDGPETGTLQALAQAPWVIAVGATDADGELLDTSSRGVPEGPHPTVVGYGTPLPKEAHSRRKRFKAQTSFAAPKIAGIAAFVSRCLHLIVGDLTDADQEGEGWSALSRPIKLPVVGIPDTGVEPKALSPLPPVVTQVLASGQDCVSVSRGEEERHWYKRLVGALREANVACQVAATPDTVKRALELMARPLPNHAPHEVGAGLVDEEQAQQFLSSLTPARFIQLLCPDVAGQMGQEVVQALDKASGPLWDTRKIHVLRQLFREGIRYAIAKVR